MWGWGQPFRCATDSHHLPFLWRVFLHADFKQGFEYDQKVALKKAQLARQAAADSASNDVVVHTAATLPDVANGGEGAGAGAGASAGASAGTSAAAASRQSTTSAVPSARRGSKRGAAAPSAEDAKAAAALSSHPKRSKRA